MMARTAAAATPLGEIGLRLSGHPLNVFRLMRWEAGGRRRPDACEAAHEVANKPETDSLAADTVDGVGRRQHEPEAARSAEVRS